MIDLIPEDLLANLYGFYSARAHAVPGARVVEEEGLLLIDTRLPNRELNIGFVTGPVRNPHAAVRKAHRFMGGSRFWRFEAPLALAPDFASSLEEAGLTEMEVRPAFTLTPDEASLVEVPPGFEAIEVTSPAGRRQFYETVSLGFSGRPLPPSVPAERLELASGTPFLGRLRGEPIATAFLFVHRGVAGLYAVSTIENARRKGYGRAISEAAVQHGFRLGCTVAFLQSTEMATGVYESIGFRRNFEHAVWRTPA